MLKKLLSVTSILSLMLSVTNINVNANYEESQNHTENQYHLNLETLNSDGWKFEIVSYDEMINALSKQENISITETMLRASNEQKASYLRASRGVDVTNEYNVSVEFYLDVNYSGSTPISMNRVVSYTINRNNNLNNFIKSKQFSGDLYVNLEDEKNLFFWIDGDFYDNGTTTFSGGGELKIGEKGKVTGTVTYASNHYAYCFYDERLTLK